MLLLLPLVLAATAAAAPLDLAMVGDVYSLDAAAPLRLTATTDSESVRVQLPTRPVPVLNATVDAHVWRCDDPFRCPVLHRANGGLTLRAVDTSQPGGLHALFCGGTASPCARNITLHLPAKGVENLTRELERVARIWPMSATVWAPALS